MNPATFSIRHSVRNRKKRVVVAPEERRVQKAVIRSVVQRPAARADASAVKAGVEMTTVRRRAVGTLKTKRMRRCGVVLLPLVPFFMVLVKVSIVFPAVHTVADGRALVYII